jgi:hypothetical protein
MQIFGEPTFQFVDNRLEAVAQRKLQEMANISPRAMQFKAFQDMANNSPQAAKTAQLQVMADNHSAQKQQPIQKKENNTGLPDNLKTGMENLSGMSLDDVKVHRNSDKPAQLQAHAYAQGTDIHLASGQEKHLPHEAWHVVQQKQGRVKPTIQMKGKVNVNENAGLEKEADVMGAKALVPTAQLEGGPGVEEKLQGKSASVLHTAGASPGMLEYHGSAPVQMRGENPHKQPGEDIGGRERTAHHIIGHAKLVAALGELEDDDKRDVLVAAIPSVLTPEMMKNLKVELKYKGEAQKEELASIREQLVDKEFKGEIYTIHVDDIRHSFFEWMGGNQFSGPSTTIRAEPNADKDALDTDGQYIFGKQHGGAMNEMGGSLYGELNKGHKDQLTLKAILLKITAAAKDIAAASFNPEQWEEVTDINEISDLAEKLKRTHLPNYVFFKVKSPDGIATFVEPFDLLESTNAGGSEFNFGGKKIDGHKSSPFAYFPYEKAKTVNVPSAQKMTLRQAILEVASKPDHEVFAKVENDVRLSGLDADSYQFIVKDSLEKFKLKAKGYKMAPCQIVQKNPLTMSAVTLNLIVEKSLPSLTLSKYLTENGALVSTWLPKGLYDEAKRLNSPPK